jgi:hypothetical protein
VGTSSWCLINRAVPASPAILRVSSYSLPDVLVATMVIEQDAARR